jgi:exonuclease III
VSESKIHKATRLWSDCNYGVVCLQETHTNIDNSNNAALAEDWQDLLLDLGWHTFFSHGTRNSAGVCIAIDATLLHSGILHAQDTISICNATPGRGIKTKLKWAGHDFDLINVYLPNTPTEQRSFLEFLQSTIDPQRPTLIMGDFNFVACKALDRHRGVESRGDPAHGTWKQLFPALIDTYRRLHPKRREFSFFHRDQRSASRIDRAYASRDIIQFIINSNISTQHGPSDHNPISITLAGKTGVPRAAGRPRVRLGFTKVQKLSDLFVQGAQQIMSSAPSEMNELIKWTPTALNKIAILGRRLHAASRANKTEAIESVEKDLDQLRQQYQNKQGNADHLLGQLMQKRKDWQTLWYAHCETSDIHKYRQEIHRGERVTDGKARALRRPAFAGTIPGLKNDTGRVVVRTAAANVAAKHYASVSKQPTTCPIAQQQVMMLLLQVRDFHLT